MTNRPQQFDGKVAIVTGGSRGIGWAIARALLRERMAVMISGRDSSTLAGAVKKLQGERPGCVVSGLVADVRHPEQVQALVRETVSQFGGLDVLINNAGVGSSGEVAEQSVEDWRLVIDTNLTGVFLCCHEAIPHLRRRGGGWIINISSLAGKNPFAGMAAYCASKAGLNAFSEALMQEVRYDDIRVSYIMPGSVGTTFGRHEVGPGSQWKLSPDDIAQVVVDLIAHDRRSLPSRVEIRPSKPKR